MFTHKFLFITLPLSEGTQKLLTPPATSVDADLWQIETNLTQASSPTEDLPWVFVLSLN